MLHSGGTKGVLLSRRLHSGGTKGVLLKKDGKCIVWEHWEQAAKWDRETNSRRIHRKITTEHLNPDGPQKMRNSLAEEMLDNDMLYLMTSYRNSFESNGANTLMKRSI